MMNFLIWLLTAERMGVFIPHDPQEYGAAPGKTRQMFYPICQRCKNKGEPAFETIEAILLYELTQVAVN